MTRKSETYYIKEALKWIIKFIKNHPEYIAGTITGIILMYLIGKLS